MSPRRTDTTRQPTRIEPKPAPPPKPKEATQVDRFLEAALKYQYANGQEGGPRNIYQFGGGHGGDDGDGVSRVNCSGLVIQALYDSVPELGKKYGMTADGMYNATQRIPVDESQLKPGDLLFRYGPSDRLGKTGAYHVGIYLGSGKFIHAPATGKPVQVANMTDYNWDAAGRLAEFGGDSDDGSAGPGSSSGGTSGSANNIGGGNGCRSSMSFNDKVVNDMIL